uniref:Putative DNA binding, helix-turn-helix domain containing protein n=1 Tax=viral metagenome TaxID=1070528 RepID=A0A6M3K5L4_9ZZZZ
MGTVTGVLLNGVPVEEHIKSEAEKEFIAESIEERRDTISDIKRSLEKRQIVKQRLPNRHSRIKHLDRKQIRKEYGHIMKREKPVALEILEQLMIGAASASKLSKDLKVKKDTIYAHLSLMARGLPEFITKSQSPMGMVYRLRTKEIDLKKVYEIYKQNQNKLRSAYKKRGVVSEVKAPESKESKDHLSSAILELVRKSLQGLKPITIDGKKLDVTVTVSGSVEILFGVKE